MFFDEDGDLAHEFYKQVVRDNRLTMERCYNLRPQVCIIYWLLCLCHCHGSLCVCVYWCVHVSGIICTKLIVIQQWCYTF